MQWCKFFLIPNHALCVAETGYQTGKVGPKAPSWKLSLLLGFPLKQVEPYLQRCKFVS